MWQTNSPGSRLGGFGTPLLPSLVNLRNNTYCLCRTIRSVLVWQYHNERLLSVLLWLLWLPFFASFSANFSASVRVFASFSI